MRTVVSTIRTDKLRKVYGGRQVVSDVSISVSQGEVVGLLGPNGAGKTTSFYMIVGMVRPDSGHIFLDGQAHVQAGKAWRGLPAARGVYLPQALCRRQHHGHS